MWLKRVAKNLLPLSKSQTLQVALKEWYYDGICNDLGEPSADCELCDHPEIKYQFEIENEFTGNKLLVGSECITKFRIPVIEDDKVLSDKEAAKKVQEDRNKLIEAAKIKRVIEALVVLGSVDVYFTDKIDRFIDYYKSRDGFTPRQLLVVLRGFKFKGIKFTKSDFKIKFRRHRERDQLLAMTNEEVKILWDCLSKVQKLRYLKLKGEI